VGCFPEITIEAYLLGSDEVSEGFKRMGASAEAMGDKTLDMSKKSESSSLSMRGLAREVASFGASAFAVARVGEQFGLLTKQQADSIQMMGGVVATGGTLLRTFSYIAKASEGVSIAESARGAAHGFADAMASGITRVGGAIVSALVRIETSSLAVAFAEKARGVAHFFADSMSSGVTKIVGAIVSALTAIRVSSIATAIAENARAVAHAIANAVASLGVAVPIIIAAAAAAAVGIAAYTGNIPHLAKGGIVKTPTVAVIGERGPEAVIPLSIMSQEIMQPFKGNQMPLAWAITFMRPLESFSEGGIVAKPTLALIGERGPEAVIPLSRMESAKSVDVTVNVYGASDPYETGESVKSAIRDLRRSGII